ncbi:MAG: hypothetical protein DSY89_05830, partial [Deltaproteobacteria bacterium]
YIFTLSVFIASFPLISYSEKKGRYSFEGFFLLSGRDHPVFFTCTRYCNILLYHSISQVRGKSQGGG